MMALQRRTYPQVDPGAGGLMHRAYAVCPPQATVRQALALLRRRRLRLLVTREGDRAGVVLPADLKGARALGLESRQGRDAARGGSPVGPAPESGGGGRRLLPGCRPALP